MADIHICVSRSASSNIMSGRVAYANYL